MTAQSTPVLRPLSPTLLDLPILTATPALLGHPTDLDQLGTQTPASLQCQMGPLVDRKDHYSQPLSHIFAYHFRLD